MSKKWDRRGSLWHRWDFHVHTPMSFCQEYGPRAKKETWDNYVTHLIKASKEQQVQAICIQDYFTFDGYFKLIEDGYYDKDRRLLKHDTESCEILILPGIELRYSIFPKEESALNFHMIADNSLSKDTLENDLLAQISIDSDSTLTKWDLIKHGYRNSRKQELPVDEMEALNATQQEEFIRKAYETITIDHRKFLEWVRRLRSQPIGRRVLVVACHRGSGSLSEMTRDGRRASLCNEIINHADLIFAKSQSERDYYVKNNKPCVWGSDCHKLEELLKPSRGATSDFTWIKAELSFDGLTQSKYEPRDRVYIGVDKPDRKQIRNLIRKIEYSTANGEKREIQINPNLNVIIGGKSTGKSVLLYAIARAMNGNEVRRVYHDNIEGNDRFVFNALCNFSVTLGDGTTCTVHAKLGIISPKLLYIPQSYINSLAEGKTLDKVVLEALRENDDFDRLWNEMEVAIEDVKQKIAENINTLESLRNERYRLLEELKPLGTEDSITQEINILKLEVETLRRESGMTLDEQMLQQTLSLELGRTHKSLSEVLVGISSVDEFVTSIQATIDDSRKRAKDAAERLTLKTPNRFHDRISLLRNFATDEMAMISDEIVKRQQQTKLDLDQEHLLLLLRQKELEEQLSPLDAKTANGAVLRAKDDTITQYAKRLEQVKNLNSNLEFVADQIDKCINQVSNDFSLLLVRREELVKQAEASFTLKSAGISIAAKVTYDNESAFAKIDDLFDRRKNIPKRMLNLANEAEFLTVASRDIPQKIQFALTDLFRDTAFYIASVKGSSSFSLILNSLLDDRYWIHLGIKQGLDEFQNMSPGKRGAVLLKLMLEFSKSENPILIDQPEDNLDNRTIYSDLVKSIAAQKKRRQVILVTHNANLAVSTDAENVIVAHQNDEDEVKAGYPRFEYESGPLECSFSAGSSLDEHILSQKGIREHVCEILEGGEEAFLRRQKQYAFGSV